MKRVLVTGGGAAGLEFTISLARKFFDNPALSITLVDSNHSHVWKPLYHEVAAGTRGHGDEMSYLSLAGRYGFHFEPGNFVNLDQKTRAAVVSAFNGGIGEILPERRIPFDYLIVALGSGPETYGISGVKEHCYFLDSYQEALAFRQVLFELCLRLRSKSSAQPAKLDISIIGGGATGVELAAELKTALSFMAPYGFEPIERSIKVRIVEAGANLLSGLDEKLAVSARQQLEAMGIQAITNCQVESVSARAITIRNHGNLKSDLTVWCAGIRAPSCLQNIANLSLTIKGFLDCRETLQLTNDENIFGLGDCASVPDLSTGGYLPPKAQVASQQAAFLARAMHKHITKAEPIPAFFYRDRGTLVNLANHSALGQISSKLSGPVTFDGWPARLAYDFLHRRHQVALNGLIRGNLSFLGGYLARATTTRVKLHW